MLLQIWVEPQYGIVANSSLERKLYDGLTYTELAQVVSFVYLACLYDNYYLFLFFFGGVAVD